MVKSSKQLYKDYVITELIREFDFRNPEEIPKVVKISVNRGLGEGSRNSKELDISLKEIATITGQQPVINKAKKSIAGFKIRDGMEVGASVTLRREKMYSFLDRLIHIILPRIRDFRGISVDSFDGQGNYNLGIKDQLIFHTHLFLCILKIINYKILLASDVFYLNKLLQILLHQIYQYLIY